MRAIALFLPVILMAQTPPPKAPAAAPTSGSTASKSTAAKKSTAAPKPAATAITTDDQKAVYALGLTMYKQLKQFDLSPAEVELLKQALTDAAANKPAIDLDQNAPKIQPFAQARGARVADREKAAGQAFCAKEAAKPGAVKTDSGLIYTELKAGSGASPKASDKVKVNYRGTFTGGEEFDSSYKRNQPAEFGLGQVIKCWTEGVQKMKVGGKARLVCPSDIAYGDQGRPGIPGHATLVFEIELLDITTPPPAPAK
jgi:FKBP-type peptidyl-prolyl cis-trans isomerase FkpA